MEPFEELEKVFTTVREGEKQGHAFIPAVFRPCPPICHGANAKCSGGELHRLGRNVVELTMMVFDLDHLALADYEAVLDRFLASPNAFFAYESHSHKPPEDCRVRIVLPFKEPLPIGTPKEWSEHAWYCLVDHFDLRGKVKADVNCRDPSHFYFAPRCPPGQVRETMVRRGELFDWRKVLVAPATSSAPVNEEPAPPAIDKTRPVDLDHIREIVKNATGAKNYLLLRKLLNGESLTPPPAKRQQGDRPRYVAWRDTLASYALTLEGWEDPDRTLELARSSYAAECAEDPDGHTSWETIESLMDSALNRAASLKAVEAARRKKWVEALRQNWASTGSASTAPAPEALKVEDGTVSDPGDDHVSFYRSDDWQDRLEYARKKKGKGFVFRYEGDSEEDLKEYRIIKPTAANVALLLANHPKFKDAIRYDLLRHNIEVKGGGFFNAVDWRMLRDEDVFMTTDILSLDPNLRVTARDEVLRSRLAAVALDTNAFDPLRRHLRSLTWDGIPRIATWLERYCAVVPKDDRQRVYVRAVARKFLLGAVFRALDPGPWCQMDWAPIFESLKQRAGKTSMAKILGGEFYSDASVNTHDKDTFVRLYQSWICELPELTSLRRSTKNDYKHFMSQTQDQFRPSYGRFQITTNRRCVFIGTTNDEDYLIDETGNRRFNPIRCEGKFDLDALRADRDQLWAEAVAVYQQVRYTEPHFWSLTDEELSIAEGETKLRMKPNLIVEKIEEWFTNPARQIPENLGSLFICTEVLKESVTTRGLETQIGQALRASGFEIARNTSPRRYIVPDRILEIRKKREEAAKGMSPVAAAVGSNVVPINDRSTK